MKKQIKNIIISILIFSNLFGSSFVKSMFFPGWGEKNEYQVLSKSFDEEKISYINKRSNAIIITEAAIWLGLFLSNDFSKSYRKNYQNYGARYAEVDWSGKSDLYAAHVGNYKSSDTYNATMCEIHLSYCNEYLYLDPKDQWDWGENKDLRLRYDDMRNKSEQLDKLSLLMVGALVINRIVSTFDVLIIKRNHGRGFKVDSYNNASEVGLKLNYKF